MGSSTHRRPGTPDMTMDWYVPDLPSSVVQDSPRMIEGTGGTSDAEDEAGLEDCSLALPSSTHIRPGAPATIVLW